MRMIELEKKILQNFYNQNNNPKIEVILDYERVYGKYLDRKTVLYEGEHITDGFVDKKTSLYFDEVNLYSERIRAFTQNEFEIEIDASLISSFLEKDFQKIIDMNLKNGIDVKIVVGDFFFGTVSFYRMHNMQISNTDSIEYLLAKSLLVTYKVERI